MKHKRSLLLLAFLITLWLGLAASLKLKIARAVDPPGPSENANNEGYAMLVIGVPQEAVEGMVNAGAVNVLYSSAGNLAAANNQFWYQDSPNIADTPEESDRFGSPLITGNFNGDRYTDLVVGVPQEAVIGVDNAGAVNVLYGTADGLAAAGNQFLHQDSPGINDTVENGDNFGDALAAGDFDGNGFTDLAVGVPNENIIGGGNAGAVNVLYGSISGLTATGNQFWHQNSPDIVDEAEVGDSFGSALAVGDFDGDGFADLAVGVRNETIGDVSSAGAVNILYGSINGLGEVDNQFWHQDSPGIADAPEEDDEFGNVLAASDFNGDGFADLAIGVHNEGVGGIAKAGAVNVLYGSVNGLSSTSTQFWHQDSPGIAGGAESNDEFGWTLAAGDFNGNGFADLAVGVRSEAIGDVVSAGAVNVLYGSSGGLRAAGNQIWHQDSPGIAGIAEQGDRFGSALAACDFNDDGYVDLAVGVPLEDLNGVENAGAVNVLYGSDGGLTDAGNQVWHQNSSGIIDDAEVADFFGLALACRAFTSHPVYLPLVLHKP